MTTDGNQYTQYNSKEENHHMLQFAGTSYGNIMYLIDCSDTQWQEILDMMAKSNKYTNEVCEKANDLWNEANRLMEECKTDGDIKTLEESIKYKEQAELWEKKVYALIKTPQFNADVFIEYAEKNGITYDTQIIWDGNKGLVDNLFGRIRARFCSQGRAKR